VAFSFLECLFLFWRYLRFCKESDDVIGGSTKAAQHSVENGSGNVEAVFFKLGTGNVHHKKKNNDTRRAIAMTTVMPLGLKFWSLKFWSLKLPDFILNKDHPLPPI